MHTHPAFFGKLFDFGLGGVLVDDYALALVFGDDFLLDHRVESAEESVMSDEEMGFTTEVVEHAGHFNGDIACAYESDSFRKFLEIEEAVGGNAEFGAR